MLCTAAAILHNGTKIYLKFHLSSSKSFTAPWISAQTSLWVCKKDLQDPNPQIKQTNNQHFTGNFWIFHYVFDRKYRKYLMKYQNLIATSKRTLAPMCDVLLLRQQAFSLSLLSLSLSLPTTTYIHTCIDLCKALLLYQ